MLKRLALSFSLVLAPASAALAATQGTIGLSSTGTVDLSVPLGNVVQISGLADFTLPVYIPGSGDITAQQDVCVFANNPGGDYQIRTTSGNALGTQWRLSDGVGNFLTYDVAWVDAPGQTFADNTVTVAGWGSGDLSNNQDNGNQVDPTCAIGGESATLAIQIPEAGNLDAAADGVYADTLTIVVTPN